MSKFETHGDARKFCEKYGIEVRGNTDVFNTADSLLRAYNDGENKQSDTADGEGEAVLEGVAHLVNNIDCDTISLTRR